MESLRFLKTQQRAFEALRKQEVNIISSLGGSREAVIHKNELVYIDSCLKDIDFKICQVSVLENVC